MSNWIYIDKNNEVQEWLTTGGESATSFPGLPNGAVLYDTRFWKQFFEAIGERAYVMGITLDAYREGNAGEEVQFTDQEVPNVDFPAGNIAVAVDLIETMQINIQKLWHAAIALDVLGWFGTAFTGTFTEFTEANSHPPVLTAPDSNHPYFNRKPSNSPYMLEVNDYINGYLFKQMRDAILAVDWILADQAILSRMEAPTLPWLSAIDTSATFTSDATGKQNDSSAPSLGAILDGSGGNPYDGEGWTSSPFTANLTDLSSNVRGDHGLNYTTASFNDLQSDVEITFLGEEGGTPVTLAHNGSVELSDDVFIAGWMREFADPDADVSITGDEHGYSFTSTHKSGNSSDGPIYEDQIIWNHDYFYIKPTWKYGRT